MNITNQTMEAAYQSLTDGNVVGAANDALMAAWMTSGGSIWWSLVVFVITLAVSIKVEDPSASAIAVLIGGVVMGPLMLPISKTFYFVILVFLFGSVLFKTFGKKQ